MEVHAHKLIEGLYIFGGEDASGHQYDGLMILDTCHKPMAWLKLEYKGKQPSSRIRHAAIFNEGLGFYIIYGGINKDSVFLSDIHILKVETMTWMEVEVTGIIGEPRAGH